jgi:2-polyprenyl-3-methyl-5-hydroxy-6-metoxy-1,4-benzoquinol methylase
VNTLDRQAHWENVYQTKSERDVSWFQETPEISLDLIRATGAGLAASIIDIGGGASRLADSLLDQGYRSVTVLDLSDKALATSRARLGARANEVKWVAADVTKWQPAATFDVWHDRAAFHFLTDPQDRVAYAECVRKAVRPGGHVIIGTFALDGPERCSGLPIVRHDHTTIGEVLGSSFRLSESRRHEHSTPWDAIQKFQFSRFRREG